MSLVSRISALASRMAHELRNKVNTSHPGLARAWVCFGYVGKQMVVYASFNVASVARLGTGRYRVTFASDMPNAHYCWMVLARGTRIAGARLNDQKTAQYLDLSCATSTASAEDSPEINLTVFH